MTFTRSLTLRAVALTALVLLACGLLLAAPRALLHKPAPRFKRDDIHGHRVDLASLHGRVVLLTFWATWCAPCQIEMPYFIRWQSELGPRGLQIVAISMDDDAAPVLALTKHRNVNYPVIMGNARIGRLYGGVLGLPVTFLIDRHGNVAAIFNGESRVAAMKAQIVKLLAAE